MIVFHVALLALLAVDGGSEVVPPRLDTSNVLLLKGKSLTVTADRAAAWSAEPAGIVELKDEGGGKVTVTALRDAFDDAGGREPQAVVRACDGEACTAFTVTCLIDTSGPWQLSLVGKWLGIFDHSEHRAPLFVQNGRDIAFEDKPPKDAKPPFNIIRLRLHGRYLQLRDGGGSLKMFSGKLNDRGSGQGRFDSTPGFSGAWTAKRTP